MAWQSVGSVAVGPNDLRVTVGAVTLAAGADTLWVRCVQQGGQSPWPYGFGLLSWQTTEGRELGTAKVFGHLEGEVFRLGVGLSPVERGGVLVLEPRSYNLRWLRVSGEIWRLGFYVQSGASSSGGAGTFAAGFVSTAGTGLELARVVFP
jgi:hypothetical protein